MIHTYMSQFGFFFPALILAVGASVSEGAAGGNVQRAGRFSLDRYYLLGEIHLCIEY